MIAELKINETIYCVRRQVENMSNRVKIHDYIFYQQYK